MLIAVLALLSAVTPLSIDMYLSAFPEMAAEFGTSASMIQLTLTALLIGLAVGQLVIGPLSDRYGRRIPLLVGSLVCLVASLLCIVSPTAPVLIALRFAQGFGGAAGVVISRAIVADRATGAAAARLFGVLMVIGALAPVIAPVLGGFIVADLGWRAVFAALAVLNALMLLGVVFFTPESLPRDRRRPGGLAALRSSARTVLSNRRYLGYTLALAFVFTALFSYISASPFVLQNIVGLSPRVYSLTFGGCAVVMAVMSALSARLVTRVEPRTLLAAGVAAMVVVTGLLLITVTAGGVAPVPTIALMACFMASMGFIVANAMALATAEVRYAAGTGSAVLGFLQYALGAGASPLVGLAGEHSAVPMGIAMFGAAVLAAVALMVFTRGHRAEPADTPEPEVATAVR
ncbi:multidrug effflux MFS transporter [Mycolicibacterium fluoranthenivorans]|jgi:DHA1 family bicyclomycin/chloramphenicol resistance-like MFS transporter|uniref:MFS transporter, DHA1 family, bicyclomycin/chloramphenicol resistance protein n=1 Tax=Mycolicibacterium fluoranthenivorans TaxID=258505 RepID=A0A1G4WPL0_9MYCO|nr:multidrug effflux MFS transporter [Mycolicibacterium fluoranthenivorans]SCX27006.1 MFS transporter, DHA1 family, bicyclomycin/chloramphenicol resistance protein [Mycolicibacterium fluoranthenivorans]